MRPSVDKEMLMKLYGADASPYARKVRMVIAERGLSALVEEIYVSASQDPPELIAANPLGKIPALVTDDGLTLFDSPVICAYLDAHPQGQGDRLRPHSGNERWLVMRAEALGDGLMDLGLALITEKRKPEGEKSPTLTARQRGQLMRALDRTPETLATLPQAVTLGHIAIAAALGYLDYRHAELSWREGRGELAVWHAEFAKRPSYIATMPA
ncbi:MAG: glutathione S-transferase N-terminal domain-containing protein [Rhodomicrobiaceae bacterium]